MCGVLIAWCWKGHHWQTSSFVIRAFLCYSDDTRSAFSIDVTYVYVIFPMIYVPNDEYCKSLSRFISRKNNNKLTDNILPEMETLYLKRTIQTKGWSSKPPQSFLI